ncbi:sensor histidine kinase [Streptomyces silvisoli]|uniref:Histidine kinase/HSP90-like ATPase domain-containing protein n=1 Tax=Streptomyces silvisoli TaxID=3034235 RepID=A0ABT5ZL60_9ACTN|nr:ATP-binding protein [Streptomyces silvisoli]MDF3290565.1 hypothetical protein [Streptomyces silvisoli]
MILATMLYRASHLVIGLFAVVQHRPGLPVAWLVLLAAVGCSVWVWGGALARGVFSGWAVWADVVVSGCVLPFVALEWGGPLVPAADGWVMLLGTSAASAAAVAFGRTALAGAVVVLTATHVAVCRTVGASAVALDGHLISLASSAIMAWVFWWYLNRQGRLLDAASARALAAEAQKARYAERIDHYRALHDTVLATLTAIAGGVDANSPQVRERCAGEAAYLRRLIQRTADEEYHPELGAALERAVRSAESLGLRVITQYHNLPEAPAEVAAAVADAVTEALNNVRIHAGTGRAYLTATGVGDRLVVTVVDRGRGFAPDRVTRGLGLRRSVHARLAEVGGRAVVDSRPGEGAVVELRWPE